MQDHTGGVTTPGGLKLNLGCGQGTLPGWTNVDVVPLEGVDIVFDLERCGSGRMPFEADSVDEFLLSHVIEHIHNSLPLMAELYRIAKPGAPMTVQVPYGSSDDAYEDPTHVRPYFLNSFGYFSQPCYWRADYGYRGDWNAERIILAISRQQYGDMDKSAVMQSVMKERNVVAEMTAELTAIKPARQSLRELQTTPQILLKLV